MPSFAIQLSTCLLTGLTVLSTSIAVRNHVTSAEKEAATAQLHFPCQRQENRYTLGCITILHNSLTETISNIEPSNLYIEAKDCLDFYEAGRRKNGIYVIRPQGYKDPFPVYCDMEKDGGGWTVIQRRGNYGFPDDFFMKKWDDYKRGFGNLSLEFWLGNDKISALTLQEKYKLKIDTYDRKWKHYSFEYSTFIVDNELELYKLTIGNYSVSETYDMMADSNGCRFSTVDRDNDLLSSDQCAPRYKDGWWYNACGKSFLNSFKHTKEESNVFRIFIPSVLHIGYSQMKIRR